MLEEFKCNVLALTESIIIINCLAGKAEEQRPELLTALKQVLRKEMFCVIAWEILGTLSTSLHPTICKQCYSRTADAFCPGPDKGHQCCMLLHS